MTCSQAVVVKQALGQIDISDKYYKCKHITKPNPYESTT